MYVISYEHSFKCLNAIKESGNLSLGVSGMSKILQNLSVFACAAVLLTTAYQS